MFFSQKAATLKTENQTNHIHLQHIKTIDSKESQNKNTPGCFCNKEKKSEMDKHEEDLCKKANMNMVIVRSVDNNCNSQKTADDRKNDKPKGEKNDIEDSLVKHLNGWEISKKLKANVQLFVKTFSGGKTTCMNDYVKPSVGSSPEHLILHVGTNDLSLHKSPEEIARSITDLAASIKKHDFSISNIMIPVDNQKLEEKRCEVEIVQGEELLPYLPLHENQKKPFKQRKVTFK